MSNETGIPATDSTTTEETPLPFVAPCRPLPLSAPLHWLRMGWKDMWLAPRQSLTYGTLVVLLSWGLAGIAVKFGSYFELLVLILGFILIAPILAVGTYAISEQIERGAKPSLRRCLREERRAFGNLMVFALMLLVVFLVWWRAASAVHIFFPLNPDSPDWRDYLEFLGIGSVVGAIFASIVFSAAAFSLPMLVDRRVDSVTAVVSSINAVLRNKPTMLLWGLIIVLAVAPGFALLLIGADHGRPFALVMVLLGITLPLIGHATWHAYADAIDASAYPKDAPDT
jgi:uncharacterized membrane protein